MIKQWCLTILLCVSLYSYSQELNIVVISSDPLSYYEAYRLITFQSYVVNGKRVHVFLQPYDSIASREVARTLGLTTNRFFDRAEMLYRSGKIELTVVTSDLEAIHSVSSTPNSISYVKDYDTTISYPLFPIKFNQR